MAGAAVPDIHARGIRHRELTFSVQREQGGSVLLVVAGGPRPDNWLGYPGAVVTPSVVARAIRQAIGSGWRPEEIGPAFEMALVAEAEPGPAHDSGGS